MNDTQDKSKYAEYDTFWIDDENNQYKLHISGYRGSAGKNEVDEECLKKAKSRYFISLISAISMSQKAS
jgi:hypothetical protein